MPVRVKVAESAQELEDALRLRYDVYAGEEGYFSGTKQAGSNVIVDRFDVIPPVANVMAYHGSEAIGTVRLNLDSGQGLPPEELYNYESYRKTITDEWLKTHDKPPRFGSAGMLAIKKSWRNRRDVIRALLKVGAGVGRAWEATHLMASVNAKTATMYRRMNFVSLDEEQWVEEIGENIVPMASALSDFYQWAYHGLLESNSAMLNLFANRFQRLILGAGETLFRSGDEGSEAYIIDNGTIRISQPSEVDEEESTLATLGHGALFGELSLIDAKARSANATALTNVELVALDRNDFVTGLKQRGSMQNMLEFMAARVRRADELIAALHGSVSQRMKHAFDDIESSAVPDAKDPSVLVSKIGLVQFAQNANVNKKQASDFLEAIKTFRRIEYTDRRIRFFDHDLGNNN